MTSYDERITTYFGNAVLRAGFMPVPHLLMRHYRELGMQTDHAMFLMQLMEITWDLAQPPTTIKKIADRMGVSVRTVQRYSEYLAAQGLLVIYEQFEHGAQVENSYDLSPLFERLAALAPEPPLSGTPRERRRRGVWTNVSPVTGTAARPAMESVPPVRKAAPLKQGGGSQDDIPPRDTHVIPPCDTGDMGGNDIDVSPPHVTSISPTLPRGSGLKGVKNPSKKHQKTKETSGGGADVKTHSVSAANHARQTGGWSLRWQQALTPQEVDGSLTLLEQFGVHRDIAAVVAASLAPSEVWSLGAYARAARLGPAWIAKQVYSFETRQPRSAPLARRYDEIGRQLTMLPPPDAFALIELIDRCCPGSPEDVLRDNFYCNAAPRVQVTGATLWALMNEARHGHVPRLDVPQPSRTGAPQPSTELAAAPPRADLELWQKVLALLRPHVPQAEFETWFKDTRLIQLDQERAIIGTPNVFVREHVATHYLPLITAAIGEIVGSPIVADAVIGGVTFSVS